MEKDKTSKSIGTKMLEIKLSLIKTFPDHIPDIISRSLFIKILLFFSYLNTTIRIILLFVVNSIFYTDSNDCKAFVFL